MMPCNSGNSPTMPVTRSALHSRAQGESDAVADAIRDHYKPVGQGDDVPTALVTVAVSMADKLDTLFGFFYIDEKPTGSKDPFALRRATLAIWQILDANGIRLPLSRVIDEAAGPLSLSTAYAVFKGQPLLDILAGGLPSAMALGQAKEDGTHDISINGVELNSVPSMYVQPLIDWIERSSANAEWRGDVINFFADRLKVQQREAGVRHDLIDAVFALGGEDDLVRLLARVKALQAFVATDEGVNLLAGYKRAANILKAADGYDPHAAAHGSMSKVESDLLAAVDYTELRAASDVQTEDFEGAMAALASLRAPIDAFFEGVMVNDPDPDKRAFRLGLLARFRDAVHRVADFSKIEG
jgi:glycyl-tRNA synthetase beta chain